MKRASKKLSINPETIRLLTSDDERLIIGGGASDPGAKTQPNCARPASLPNCTTTTL